MKKLFVFILFITGLLNYTFYELVLFTIGNSKIYVFDIIYICAAIIVMFFYFRPKKKDRHEIIGNMLILIVLLGFLNSFHGFGEYGMSSFGERARSQYYLVFPSLLLLKIFKTKEDIQYLLKRIYRIGIIIAIYILLKFILQALGVVETEDKWQRFSNGAGDLFISFGIIYLYVKYSTYRILTKWEKLVALLLFAGLLLGQFRTLWIGTIGALLFLMLFNVKNLRSLLKTLFIGVFAVTIVILLRNYILPDTIAESFERSAQIFEQGSDDSDWLWRLVAWDQYFQEAKKDPIFGKGMGAPLPVLSIDKIYENVEAHNGWIMYFYNQGIIGVLLNLITHIIIYVILFRFIKASSSNIELRFIGLVLLGMHTIQFLYLIPYTENLYLWMPAAMASVISNYKNAGKDRIGKSLPLNLANNRV